MSERDNIMKTIDCFGEICPIPILRIQQYLDEIDIGEEFMVVVDHSCSIEAIRNKYTDDNINIRIDEVMNGVWEVFIKKLR